MTDWQLTAGGLYVPPGATAGAYVPHKPSGGLRFNETLLRFVDGADTAVTLDAAAGTIQIDSTSTVVGIPTGGATDEVLTKIDGTDYNVAWAAAAGGGGGTAGHDRRWNVATGETTIDEFNDGSLAGGWTRVDGTGAASGNLAWTEGADVLSAANAGGDTATVFHGIVIPLSGFGGSITTGDAFISCVTLTAPATNYSFGGIVLSDGTTHGAGNQVAAVVGRTGTVDGGVDGWAAANWARTSVTTSVVSLDMVAFYIRLVCTAANTWRADGSPDGVSWIKGTSTFSKTITPTQVGFMSSSYGTSVKHVMAFEFLRRVAGVS